MSENKNNDKTENSGAKVYEFDQKRNKADEIGEADDNGDELIRRKKAPVLRKRNKDNNEKRNSKYGMISVVIVILLIVFICADIYTGGALAAVSGQISAFFSKSSTEKFSVKTDAQTVYDFSSFGDGFALLADSGIIHVDSSGRISSKQQLSYNKPAVEICGKRALIFDRGGKSYTLEKNGSVYSQLTVEDKIIDAALSKKDNYALAVKGENSKTILYGFDNSGKVIYQWDCPDGYIADIAITPSGGKAAATVINSSNAVLSTQIYILDF